MAVTPDDVRHVAALARLGVPAERIPGLVRELNTILEHMEVLRHTDTEGEIGVAGVGAQGTPLREDRGPKIPLERPLEEFAPHARDGFLLVPRLATHETDLAETIE